MAMGVVPQLDNLDVELTCRQILTVFARLYRVPGPERRGGRPARARIANLTGRADTIVRELSGGMRRRLLVARGLIHRPQLVLLDEPTVGLDPQVRQELWTLIDGLRADGVTVLMSTHYIEEAERLADTVAVMSAGRIIAQGTPAELILDHAGREVIEVYGPPDAAGRARGRCRAPRLAPPAQRPRRRRAARRAARRRRARGRAPAGQPRGRVRGADRAGDRVSAAAPRTQRPPQPGPAGAGCAGGGDEPRRRPVQALLEGDHVLLDRAADHLPAGVRSRLRLADPQRRPFQVRAVRRDRRRRDRGPVLLGVPGMFNTFIRWQFQRTYDALLADADRRRGADHRPRSCGSRSAPASTGWRR